MINKIKTLMFALSAMLVLAAPMAIPATALAVEPEQINKNICEGVKLEINSTDGGATCEGTGTNTLSEKIEQIINILSAIIGAVAVFMIIYAGFRYITSGGSEKGIETAKKTIMYALIGLVIVALAQLIVRFVVRSASGV
jgi:cytochrome bd-type quinol oxidase subunit 2